MTRAVITRRIIERVAENRIREAQRRGQFDNLPGAGRRLPDIDEPYDPTWWIRAWMRRERLKGGLLATLPGRQATARPLLLQELLGERTRTTRGRFG